MWIRREAGRIPSPKRWLVGPGPRERRASWCRWVAEEGGMIRSLVLVGQQQGAPTVAMVGASSGPHSRKMCWSLG